MKECVSTRGGLHGKPLKKSAEVTVADMRRTESIGISSMTDKGGMADNDRKH